MSHQTRKQIVFLSSGSSPRIVVEVVKNLSTTGEVTLVANAFDKVPRNIPNVKLRTSYDYLNSEARQVSRLEALRFFLSARDYFSSLRIFNVPIFDALEEHQIFWIILRAARDLQTFKNITLDHPDSVTIVPGNVSWIPWVRLPTGALWALPRWVIESAPDPSIEVITEAAQSSGIVTTLIPKTPAIRLQREIGRILLPILVPVFTKFSASARNASAISSEPSSDNLGFKVCMLVTSERDSLVATAMKKEIEKIARFTVIASDSVGGKDQATKNLRAEHIDFKYLRRYVKRGDTRLLASEMRRFFLTWEKLKNDPEAIKAHLQTKLPVDIILGQIGFYFRLIVPQIGKRILSLHHVVETENPDAFIVLDDNHDGRAISSECHIRGIPVIWVNWTSELGTNYNDFLPWSPSVAEKYAKVVVWGKKMAEAAVVDKLIPREKIAILGNPLFDLKLARYYATKSLEGALGLVEEPSPYIVFTSAPASLDYTEEKRRAAIQIVIDAFSKIPNEQLIVKLHPAETADTYLEFLGKKRRTNNIKVLRDCDLYSILGGSKLVITCRSTTGFEALLLGKPLISLCMSGDPELFPYSHYGAGVKASTPNEIVFYINKLADDEWLKELEMGRRKFLSDYASSIDGCSSRRIALAIRGLFKPKGPN